MHMSLEYLHGSLEFLLAQTATATLNLVKAHEIQDGSNQTLQAFIKSKMWCPREELEGDTLLCPCECATAP